MSLVIRDFIFLDTERLKSIIAQIEKGLLDSTSQTTSGNKNITSEVGGSLFHLLKVAGGVNYVLHNQTTETKTLHDNIYNRVEEALIENNLLTSLPGNINIDNISEDKITSIINNNSFILAKGRVVINDYTRARLIFENMNEIARFIVNSRAQSLPAETSKQKRHKKQEIKQSLDAITLDKEFLKGLMKFFDIFYKDRIVIKVHPFVNSQYFHLVGNIKSEFLREDISSIIYKYGTAPVSEWSIFAQVASIPPKNRAPISNMFDNTALDSALNQMFDALRGIEMVAESVTYPEIAITPIAIYRD